jgi:hypothetical protein
MIFEKFFKKFGEKHKEGLFGKNFHFFRYEGGGGPAPPLYTPLLCFEVSNDN